MRIVADCCGCSGRCKGLLLSVSAAETRKRRCIVSNMMLLLLLLDGDDDESIKEEKKDAVLCRVCFECTAAEQN